MTSGGVFADETVAAAYRHRPDYPPGVYAHLAALGGRRARLLDLGCGPGKLALGLAANFAEVIAVDPSAAMLDQARRISAGRGPNIWWVEASAEAVELEGDIDLIVAGESGHWMDPAIVFPKLAKALSPKGTLAIVNGDGPSRADWLDAWQAVMAAWVERQGGAWNDEAYRRRISAHEPWFDLEGRATFEAEVAQPLDALIEAQHSRATWARPRMGDAAAAQFQADLRHALAPFSRDGAVRYIVATTVRWGRPRGAPRD